MEKRITNKMNLIIFVLCVVTAIVGVCVLIYAVRNNKPIYYTGSFYRAIGKTNNKYYLLNEEGYAISAGFDELSTDDLQSTKCKNYYIRYQLGSEEEGVLDVLSGNPIFLELDKDTHITDIGGDFHSLFTVNKNDKYGMIYYKSNDNSSKIAIPVAYDCISSIGESDETIGIRNGNAYLLRPYAADCKLICTGSFTSCITLDAKEGFYAIYSADSNTFQIVHEEEILEQAEYLSVYIDDDGNISAENLQHQDVSLICRNDRLYEIINVFQSQSEIDTTKEEEGESTFEQLREDIKKKYNYTTNLYPFYDRTVM